MTKQRSSPNAAVGDNNSIAGGWVDEYCVDAGAMRQAVHAGSLGRGGSDGRTAALGRRMTSGRR
jgi:hypothetical protein